MFDLEDMATSLQLKNTALSNVAEIWYALAGGLNNRVPVFKKYRVVFKAALRHLQREMVEIPLGMSRCQRILRRQGLISGPRGGVEAELRRAMEAEAEKRGIIEARERTGEEMLEETLEGETRMRDKAEARLRVSTEALERAAEEAEWR